MNFVAKMIRRFLGLDEMLKENEALKKELERVNELRTIRVAQEKKVETVNSNGLNYETMPWQDLTRYHKEVTENWLADIQAEIISKGYKAIPEILEPYRTEMVQLFVLTQKIALGSYAPEYDNLDAYNKSELIRTACELNQLAFEKRMIEAGKGQITKKQHDMLVRYGVKEADIPQSTFEASRLIEKVLKDNGVDTSKPYSNKPTERQLARLNQLTALTHIDCKDLDLSSKKAVSEAIATMQKYADEHPELLPKASEKQLELAARLMKQLNKRMTAKRKAELEAMNTSQISKVIVELQDEVNVKHPELTEGQRDYMIMLLNTLNIPYNIEEIKTLTKAQATARIEAMRREYLFVLTRKTNPGMTKEDIKKLTTEQVKSLIDAVRGENKTRDYTVDAESKDAVETR